MVRVKGINPKLVKTTERLVTIKPNEQVTRALAGEIAGLPPSIMEMSHLGVTTGTLNTFSSATIVPLDTFSQNTAGDYVGAIGLVNLPTGAIFSPRTDAFLDRIQAITTSITNTVMTSITRGLEFFREAAADVFFSPAGILFGAQFMVPPGKTTPSNTKAANTERAGQRLETLQKEFKLGSDIDPENPDLYENPDNIQRILEITTPEALRALVINGNANCIDTFRTAKNVRDNESAIQHLRDNPTEDHHDDYERIMDHQTDKEILDTEDRTLPELTEYSIYLKQARIVALQFQVRETGNWQEWRTLESELDIFIEEVDSLAEDYGAIEVFTLPRAPWSDRPMTVRLNPLSVDPEKLSIFREIAEEREIQEILEEGSTANDKETARIKRGVKAISEKNTPYDVWLETAPIASRQSHSTLLGLMLDYSGYKSTTSDLTFYKYHRRLKRSTTPVAELLGDLREERAHYEAALRRAQRGKNEPIDWEALTEDDLVVIDDKTWLEVEVEATQKLNKIEEIIAALEME